MKPDHFRFGIRFKMTINRVFNVGSQLFNALALSKDRLAQGPGIKTTFEILFDHKYNFVSVPHSSNCIAYTLCSVIKAPCKWPAALVVSNSTTLFGMSFVVT